MLKYCISIFCILISTFSFSQRLNWVFTAQGDQIGDCISNTICKQDQVCFALEYIPKYTGVLTSYTLGFSANCGGNSSPIISASSCSLNDNTDITDACSFVGLVLLQTSGSGSINVTKDVPISIHQVCFDLGDGLDLILEEDEILGLTANIDSIGVDKSYTDFIDYQTATVNNSNCFCFIPAADSGNPNPMVDCLTSMDAIKYELSDCNDVSISELPNGISATINNGLMEISGTPNYGGVFPYTIYSPSCDCKDANATIQIDSSAIVINGKCYADIQDAFNEFIPGQTIRIIKNHTTTKPGLNVPPQVIIALKKQVTWKIKNP